MAVIEFEVTAVLDGTDDLALTGITDMTVSEDLLYAVSASGEVSAYRLTSTGLVLVDQASLPSSGIAGVETELQTLTVDGATSLMATGAGAGGLYAIDSAADGSLSGAVAVPGGLPGDLAECTTVDRNGETYLVGTRVGSEQPGLWKMNADGSFAEVDAAGAGVSGGAGVTAMLGLDIGGKAYVLVAAGDSNALVIYKVEESGLTRKDVLGAEDGIGIGTPSSLALVELGGTTYAIMGASGSSTLTVAAIENDRLVLTDHVIDSLGTRFQNVTTVETVIVEGRAFLVAAGSDDGLSLLELLPDGSLVHLAALADSTETTLTNVSDIALSVTGRTLQIVVSSATEAGLTALSVELPGAEALVVAGDSGESLTGTGAADVLIDGAGEDVLEGGAGADVFVLGADGQTDTITDFEVGADSIDLSNWAFLRSTDQLTVVERNDGAEIWFDDERLVIQTATGETLTEAEVAAMDLLSVDRMLPEWSDAVTDPQPTVADPADSGTGTGNADYRDCGTGDSTYSGKGGEDTIRGNAGNDEIYGDANSDYIDGGDGDDHLHAGQGADSLYGGNGDDFLEGKEGHDLLEGGAGNDTLSGDYDRDTLYGGSGNDSLKGIKGYDILYGGTGDDYLKGGEGYDELYGEDGHDYMEGGVSNDTMDGGAGNDTLMSNQGSDIMDGGLGDDSMRGHDGHDTMQGGGGNDTLNGGAGKDVMDGGAGDDLLTGYSGADIFVFSGGNDTFTDFDQYDALQIDRDVWAGTKADLLDTAEVSDDGLMLDFGPEGTLLFQGMTDLDVVSDTLSFV